MVSIDDRCAELLERILAARVAGIDPTSLKEELKRLLLEKEGQKQDGTSTS